MERFKRTQSWQDALYSTYHITTGDPVGDIAGQLEVSCDLSCIFKRLRPIDFMNING